MSRNDPSGYSPPEEAAQTKPQSDDRAGALAEDVTPETRFATDQLRGGIFVGRERELGELQGGLREAERGHGSLFLLSGDPGIGKTRLADRLCGFAAGRGARVVWGRAWEGEGAPAYWPWVQVLRGLAEASTPADLAAHTGAGAAYLVQIVPELRNQLPDVPPAITSPDSEHARFYLFDATARFLEKAAQSRPLVLVLDDLHWADKSSLLLLEHVAQGLRDARILVIGTYRGAEARQAGPLADVLAQLARAGRPLPLRGLGEAEVDAFMEAIGKAKPDARLVSAIHRATDGNPFYIDEIVRLLLAEGVSNSGRIPIPDSVRAVIRRRLAFLPGETRRLLSIGSAVGREIDVTVLEHVCAEPVNDIAEALLPAVTAGLVTRLPDGCGRYGFAHALVRETLYDDLGPAERQRFHRAIGAALEEIRAGDLEPHLAELAHHFLEVADAGDTEKAISYLVRAGRRAAGVHGYEEAARHYEQALDVLARMASNELRRCDLLISLGEAKGRAGEFEAAKGPLLQGAELAKKLGLAEPLARAALRFGHPLPGVPFADPTHLRLLEDALAALQGEDSLRRVLVASRFAVELLYSTTPERAIVLADDALGVAQRVGTPAALAAAQTARCILALNRARYQELGDLLSEVERLAEESGDRELALFPKSLRMACDMARGDVNAADRDLVAFAQAAEELRQQWYLASMPLFRAMRAMMQGRFAEAATLIDEGLIIGTRTSGSNALLIASMQRFMLLREQGRFVELAEGRERGALVYRETVLERAHQVTLHLELGREAEARGEFERLAANDFSTTPFDPHGVIALGWLSQACASLGDANRAVVLYEHLRPRADEIVIQRAGLYCLHTVSHHLGLLATTMSRFADAERHFEDALVTSARIGARPWIPRTQFHYAEMLLRRGAAGDREKAVRLLEQSIPIAAELGMKSLLERAQALRADGEELPRPRDTGEPALGDGSIFRREGEYWTLTHQGRSFRLRDTKGLRYLARLLYHPGEGFRALDLASIDEERPAAAGRAQTHERASSDLGDAGPHLDVQAKAAYRRRLDSLRETFDEAERFNDPERASRAREEIEFLTDELARATGLAGRDRKAASAAERARSNVTMAIKAALKRIAENDAALGRYLAATIKTGNVCSYIPAPQSPISWSR